MIKIIRAEKNRDSIVLVDKTVLQDPNLSWDAKGLFAYLSTLPEDVDIQVEELTNYFNDSLTTVQTAMKELVDHGYVTEQN